MKPIKILIALLFITSLAFGQAQKKYVYIIPDIITSINAQDYLDRKADYVINKATKITTDSSLTKIIFPDGNQLYSWLFPRDYSYALQGKIEAFSANEISKVLDFIKQRIVSNIVPDHISYDGTAYPKAGQTTITPDNGIGTRSPVDNQCFFVDIVYRLYQKSGLTTYYNTNKTLIKNIVSNAALNLTDGIVVGTGFPDYGFEDQVIKTQKVLWGNLLAFNAFKQLAELAYQNGDVPDQISFENSALTIKTFVNDSLYSPIRKLYKAARGIGSNDYDVWGTAFAVYIGLANDSIGIAKNLSDSLSAYYYKGAFRHKFISDGAWQQLTSPVAYGTYQNGGYWYTPLPWITYTINLYSPTLAETILVDAITNMLTEGDSAPSEWFNKSGSVGVGKYVANATLPLISFNNKYNNNNSIDSLKVGLLIINNDLKNFSGKSNIGSTTNDNLGLSALSLNRDGSTGALINPAVGHGVTLLLNSTSLALEHYNTSSKTGNLFNFTLSTKAVDFYDINIGSSQSATNFLGFNRKNTGAIQNSGIASFNFYNNGTNFNIERYTPTTGLFDGALWLKAGGAIDHVNNNNVVDFSLTDTGHFGKITGISTEGNFGVPIIVDTVYRTSQHASINATNFSNAGVAGFYEVSYVLYTSVLRADTVGTVVFNIIANDGISAKTISSATLSLQANNVVQGVIPVVLGSGNVQFSTTFTSTSLLQRYRIYAVCKRLN